MSDERVANHAILVEVQQKLRHHVRAGWLSLYQLAQPDQRLLFCPADDRSSAAWVTKTTRSLNLATRVHEVGKVKPMCRCKHSLIDTDSTTKI